MHWINPPGWNSLESVQRAHGRLELLAILLFGLLVMVDILEHVTKDQKRQDFLKICGFTVFGLAVLAELVAYPYGHRSDALSNKQIGDLTGQIDAANRHANEAASDAINAKAAANDSAAAATRANSEAEKAARSAENSRTIASAAESLAKGARQEADTFEKRLGSAEHKADQAESHLAEALKGNIEAQAELNRLKNPRSLDVQKLVFNIKQFTGTEYTFNGVFGEQEAIDFLKIIDGALQSAGWNRVKPDGGLPSLQNLFGDPKISDWKVNLAIHNGVRVSVESPEELNTLETFPVRQLPHLVQAAVLLNFALADSINPPEAENRQPVESVNVVTRKGSERVLISVGKKP